MKLDATTITDEQICELRAHAELDKDGERRWWIDHRHLHTKSLERTHDGRMNELRLVVQVCDVALYDVHSVGASERRATARARCAEILNARAESVDVKA